MSREGIVDPHLLLEWSSCCLTTVSPSSSRNGCENWAPGQVVSFTALQAAVSAYDGRRPEPGCQNGLCSPLYPIVLILSPQKNPSLVVNVGSMITNMRTMITWNHTCQLLFYNGWHQPYLKTCSRRNDWIVFSLLLDHVFPLDLGIAPLAMLQKARYVFMRHWGHDHQADSEEGPVCGHETNTTQAYSTHQIQHHHRTRFQVPKASLSCGIQLDDMAENYIRMEALQGILIIIRTNVTLSILSSIWIKNKSKTQL